MLIGINRNISNNFEFILSYLERLKFNKYDVEILILSKSNSLKSNDIPVYNYEGKILDNFFNLKDNDNFTILVDNNNRIKFFNKNILDQKRLQLLIDRFKIES